MNQADPHHANTPPTADPGAVADEAVTRESVVTFASALARAFETAKLYEVGHALVKERCGEACAALRLACPQEATLSLGVGPDRLYDGEACFYEPGEARALAAMWHDVDLGQVTFRPTLESESLGKAIAVWLAAGRGEAKQTCAALQAATEGLVSAEPLHYERLQTTESAEMAKRSAWSWRNLFDEALDARADAAAWEDAITRLSEQLADAVDASAEAALDGLHREVHAALQDAVVASSVAQVGSSQDSKPQPLRTTVHRLGRLLETVSPKLRTQLLAALPHTPGLGSTRSNVSAGSEQDFAAVLAAVQGLDGQLNEAACESLLMCQKIANLAAGIQDESARDGDLTDETLVASLQELLDQHGPAEFTPEAYRQRLNEIADGVGGVGILTEAMRQAFAPDAVRRHAFELALHIATAGDGEPGPEAWRHLRRRLRDLVAQPQIAMIAQSARAAEARLARGGPPETLEACRALIGDLKAALAHDGRLGELLDASSDPEDAAMLLRYADESVLHEAVRRLVDTESDADAAVLAQPLRNLGGTLNAIVESLLTEAPERRVRSVRRLAPVTFATATRWLGPLLTQKNVAGRAEAFAALVEASPTWPADAAEGLLQHPDENVRAAALQRLLRQTDPASIAAIGRLLTGESTGRAPSPALIERGVQALLQQRSSGHGVLRTVLEHANQRRFGKRRATLEPVVEAVRKHADPADARLLLQPVLGAAA
ncbi:MAG: hypothetical protein AAGH92_04205 [Planctomycetota bacterium]